MVNSTLVKEFLLLGFEGYEQIRALLFILILAVYTVTIFSNLLIIGLIGTNESLHYPMYIFLCNLSVSDILFTTNVLPNLLSIIPKGRGTISFNGCVTQLFFHGFLGSSECHLLTMMSYDRYLAICNPLNYHRIMGVMLQRCILLTWTSSFILMFLPVVLLLPLHFCGPNIIDHFFCDLDPLLALSCSDTFIVKTVALVFSVYVICLSFPLIISSYARILVTILRIPSSFGRQKTFSTCSAHLLVVCTYFLSVFSIYSNLSHVYPSKFQTLLYILVPPLLNPIIYALRNKEIQSALRKLKTTLKKINL